MLACSAITSLLLVPGAALAQGVGTDSEGRLEEIVVTAQKREQSMQDVPIAITALTQETLQANRITTVNDLSSIAPGVSVRQTTGGTSTPAFTIRGQLSYGFVPGSDKQVSIYLDGVYIGSPRGSIFDLPDVARLEVLRGPQGTLFGRNATAGAVSVTTRDPDGKLGGRLEGTVGNLGAYRVRGSVSTPQFGPFSAYFSYLRNYRHGEIRNAAAGMLWDRTAAGLGTARSPEYLGTIDTNSYFAAVKFEPSDSFKVVYKYDRSVDHGTADGTPAISFNTQATGSALTDGILAAIAATNNLYLASNGKRPDVATNGFTIPRDQQAEGHSVTATWQPLDNLTVKNIFSYRKSHVFSPNPIDGISPVSVTPAVASAFGSLFGASAAAATPGFSSLTPAQQGAAVGAAIAATTPLYNCAAGSGPRCIVGNRLMIIGSAPYSVSSQWSNETQVNYSSDKLNITAGALWYRGRDRVGGPVTMANTLSFRFDLNTMVNDTTGIVPQGNQGINYNQVTSLAAYGQIEYKITPELELVGGIRVTNDRKTGSFVYNSKSSSGVISPTTTLVSPDYDKTKPSYMIGVNYKPNSDILLYGKWSSSFVSGGTVVGLPFEPESASSYEVGIKADWFDRRLRTNITAFHVDYKHYGTPGSTSTTAAAAYATGIWTPLYGSATATALLSAASTFVIDFGNARAQGIEAEVTAAPVRGLTLGANIGYTDFKYTYINPIVLTANAGFVQPTDRPKVTAAVFGAYETQPLTGDMTLQMRLDGQYRSTTEFAANPALFLQPDNANASVLRSKPYWLVNGRVALRHIPLGPVQAELAVWGKNLTNRRDPLYALNVRYATMVNFVTARTYGLDLNVEF
ncbi:TonB-dependent receptor [Novosphingobium bradum]|uniref:TonB-dependent receptor n=1 Tax=Novosphingobium bradum TaxID=1737444 RepID=A0ABV7IM23_9SPHN